MVAAACGETSDAVSKGFADDEGADAVAAVVAGDLGAELLMARGNWGDDNEILRGEISRLLNWLRANANVMLVVYSAPALQTLVLLVLRIGWYLERLLRNERDFPFFPFALSLVSNTVCCIPRRSNRYSVPVKSAPVSLLLRYIAAPTACTHGHV